MIPRRDFIIWKADTMTRRLEDLLVQILQFQLGKVFWAAICIYIALITLVSFNLGNDFGDTAFASTFAFAVLGLSQMLHCFNCKFEGRIRFKKLFSNSFMNYSVIITTFIIMFLVLTPAGALFGLETLNFLQFIICLGISFTIIPFTELVKAITKKL